MQPHQRSALRQNWPTLTIWLLVLAAAAVRVPPLAESLWIDELHTAWCALASLDEVAAKAALGNQSPLFFWLQWLLVRTLGPGELALRLPGFLAGSLLPLAVYLVARRWTSAAVGLVAAAIIAVDPLAIFYATEARPYALVQLLAVIHVGLTAALFADPSPRLRVSWIILAAILFHLHYTAGLLFAAEVIAYLLAKSLRPRDVAFRWSAAAIDLLLAAAFMLPALGTLRAIYARRSNWADFVPQTDLWQALVWWPGLAGCFYLLAAAITGRRPSAALLLAACWALVPALIAWLATATDVARLFYPRYLVIVPPAAALLAAWCLQMAPWQWPKWLFAALLIAVSALSGGVPQRLVASGLPIAARSEDWRGLVVWLNDQHAARPYPVLVASGLIEAKQAQSALDEDLRAYLLFPVASLYALEVHSDELSPLNFSPTGRLDQTTEMLILHRGGAWLVVRGDKQSASRLATAVAARLKQTPGEARTWRVTSEWTGGQVHVLSVETAQP